ncbi:hypothetical protein [Piscinibacter sp. XHJ-5]|uniref:hypothetical protein n=1 Tax=Piscinibacter sp. XHJ-5 TaxID=3037797 RepID=UPI002452FD6E|nr:hypothetical protein [Piscinibacter sp. XHJ-5]
MSHVVKVLIVTDNSGGFLADDFHLGEFVGVLQNTAWEGFGVEITKAHRENVTAASVGADLVNFDFASHDLSQYDEILLFPIRRDDQVMLSPGATPRNSNATDAEVAAIARFMDAGGGVFATGDHEDLGAGLCARLPRVRNMRRWYWRNPGPNGEPPAPFGTPGLATQDELRDRYDTLRAGLDADPTDPNANYQFDDQSDTVAQTIRPRMFEVRNTRYLRQRWPHPLLCSPEGIVRQLPDHAHEGHCEVPANLDLRVTTGGYDQDEYPLVGGSRLSPVVVAHATVIGGHETFAPYKPAVNGRIFGVIGAFDGHRAERAGRRMGRVVVDATWHHFFNINLVGDPRSGEAAKRLGFRAPLNPGQPDHYRMIKHYFRNIIYWLIPAHRRHFMLYAALATMLQSGQFSELNPLVRERDLVRPGLPQLRALSQLADAYFRRARGACWTLEFVLPLLAEFDPLRRFWERVEQWVDPWTPQRKAPSTAAPFDPALLTDVAVGAAVLAAMQAHADSGLPFGMKSEPKQLAAAEEQFHTRLPNALELGMRQLAHQLEADREELAALTSVAASSAASR